MNYYSVFQYEQHNLKNQITIDPLEEVDCILNYNDIIMYGGSGPHKSHITSL